MSRYTAITILAIVAFLTVGGAVALADAVTPGGTDNGGSDSWTCPNGGWEDMQAMHDSMLDGDWGAMKEHHESIHGEGSWDDMPGPGASTEEMRKHHESIHGEGSWDDMPGNTGNTGDTGTNSNAGTTGTGYGPMMGGSAGTTGGHGSMMGGNW